LTTRDTVFCDTPAARATSSITTPREVPRDDSSDAFMPFH
jgi:hypothetical protein